MSARIFVVDDDPAMVEAVAAVLSLDGFEVDGASDGAAALRAVLRTRRRSWSSTSTCPASRGWELCEIVRRQPLTRDLPVLFLTGRGEVRDRITAMQVGGTDHLTKPFRAEELRARVRALTASGREEEHHDESAAHGFPEARRASDRRSTCPRSRGCVSSRCSTTPSRA